MRIPNSIGDDSKKAILYILLLFLVTRVALVFIGTASYEIVDPYHGPGCKWTYSNHLWLDIWGVWDSGWYRDIANHGYPSVTDTSPNILDQPHHKNYGFFPLYPLLMRIVSVVIGDVYLSGLLISNILLLVTALYLYKLVELDSGPRTGLRTVKYLFLFPSAFLLSGVLSESLFLTLLVLCFYFSRKERWLWAGVIGFFLSLARPVGVFMVIPLFWEYLEVNRFRIKPNVLFLSLIPFGLFAFCLYNYYLTGNFLTFVIIKAEYWRTALSNPSVVLLNGLLGQDPYLFTNSAVAVFEILFLLIVARKLRSSYLLAALLLILIPISSGMGSLVGVLRFSVIAFPFFLSLAQLGEDRRVDALMSIFLALLQGFFMVAWCNGFLLIL
jgi:hypothetical protein